MTIPYNTSILHIVLHSKESNQGRAELLCPLLREIHEEKELDKFAVEDRVLCLCYH